MVDTRFIPSYTSFRLTMPLVITHYATHLLMVRNVKEFFAFTTLVHNLQLPPPEHTMPLVCVSLPTCRCATTSSYKIILAFPRKSFVSLCAFYHVIHTPSIPFIPSWQCLKHLPFSPHQWPILHWYWWHECGTKGGEDMRQHRARALRWLQCERIQTFKNIIKATFRYV